MLIARLQVNSANCLYLLGYVIKPRFHDLLLPITTIPKFDFTNHTINFLLMDNRNAWTSFKGFT